ncbi:MAG: SDR family NAD(P)-dependent oxidoreductase [Cytophagaceae bacterium]|nr:SDR family NAD(P)-dependent oxidoreductase [Cytophagaceae bacterium]
MKHYIITGTSRGLGHAMALELLEEGNCWVIGISRKNTISHPNYKHISLDLADIDKLIASLDEIFPSIQSSDKIVLINNAAVLGQVAHVGNIPNKKMQEVLNINTVAPAILMNEFIKRYYKCNTCQKMIVNVSSGAGKKPVDGWSAYCASKAALDMFSGVVSVEKRMDKNNIRIFSVSPGIIDTEMQDQIRKVNKEDFSRLNEFIEYKKEGMLVSPRKVAKKYLYLIENETKFEDVLVSVRDF